MAKTGGILPLQEFPTTLLQHPPPAQGNNIKLTKKTMVKYISV